MTDNPEAIDLVALQNRLQKLKQAYDLTYNLLNSELTIILYEINKITKNKGEEKTSQAPLKYDQVEGVR